MSTHHIRSKWAAVGAAVAVSLGAGGIGITQATTSTGEKPIYLPIEPCRLADTRTDFQVGPRSAPLGANETYTLSGQDAVGNCNLPSESTALSLNVTAIDATAPTFVSLFPAGASLPVASHLNPLPGQGPVPNAVNVDLSAGGEFSIYNLAGSVNIFIDVVGVYDDHTHDDRYYQKSEVDAALGAKANSADVYTKGEVDAAVGPKANSTDVYTKAETDAGFAPVGLAARAFGYVNAAGALISGTGVTAASYEAGSSRYRVDLAFSYFFSSFATTVTTTCDGDTARTSSSGGDLLVYITDSSGARSECGFGFVVFGS